MSLVESLSRALNAEVDVVREAAIYSRYGITSDDVSVRTRACPRNDRTPFATALSRRELRFQGTQHSKSFRFIFLFISDDIAWATAVARLVARFSL
jgi:hypothetical protein